MGAKKISINAKIIDILNFSTPHRHGPYLTLLLYIQEVEKSFGLIQANLTNWIDIISNTKINLKSKINLKIGHAGNSAIAIRRHNLPEKLKRIKNG
ncbi:MAG: hypothetical protein AB9879_07400 [Methanothrix sp.]